MADEKLPSQDNAGVVSATPISTRKGFRLALRVADVFWYRFCDAVSGPLIFLMIVFSPWAFGTTQAWAIWAMNIAGYTLGVLWLMKLFIRELKGYPALRWNQFSARSGPPAGFALAHRLTQVLASLTLIFLGYCLTAALNAAATYHAETKLFEYHEFCRWLPHSFDGHRTWFYLWMYLGLAASFWAALDWLSGLTTSEERALRGRLENESGRPVGRLSSRLRWLLWLLCINGALLALEAIVQRAAGSNKLLFLIRPQVHEWGDAQFGPYAYRSNAAQFFNLLWPVCLGFWWTLQRGGGRRARWHHVLLFCAIIMAACPIISTSRGGALVSVGLMVASVLYMTWTSLLSPTGQRPWLTPSLLGIFLASAVGLGWYFGWDRLAPRMDQLSEGYSGREQMFDDARPMAADYPMFGTGPGSFATVFQLYRISNATYWPEQLHNDWLETRITFGWVGLGLLLAALACVGLRRFAPGGIHGGHRLGVLAWLSLAGCLIHAVYDFPLQIHSILFLFLIICAILFSLSGRAAGTGR
jgi:hypothetical protein